CLEPFDYFKCI
ncbi:hypothetical protein CTY75_02980, partial [Acinetobacter baumannii]|nr:hypothetical protein [Acinetobacter baumannii]